jgi:acetyl-CoA acetyltransferase
LKSASSRKRLVRQPGRPDLGGAADPPAPPAQAMGCVLPAGQGQAPARQAALWRGLPDSGAGATLNKMCGSGMRRDDGAHDMLLAGSADVMVAGGMESMTNAPYLMFARGRLSLWP